MNGLAELIAAEADIAHFAGKPLPPARDSITGSEPEAIADRLVATIRGERLHRDGRELSEAGKVLATRAEADLVSLLSRYVTEWSRDENIGRDRKSGLEPGPSPEHVSIMAKRYAAARRVALAFVRLRVDLTLAGIRDELAERDDLTRQAVEGLPELRRVADE